MSSQKSTFAVQTFASSYNCSQSVFSVFAPDFGISRDLSLRLAGPLGAGIARRQETCGAVTGALLALGLKYGKGENGTDEDKKRAFAVAQDFIQDFEAQFGSIVCLHLLDNNCMDTEEGAAAINKEDMFRTRCTKYVKFAVEKTEELLLR
ncbi:MAG: GCAxxG family protein [Bacteroidetes bacterium]|jgi:C_GCAxxG_C_C family probable redox protein|nr:GCAxxG family protein [Bacteroidota bacterium]